MKKYWDESVKDALEDCGALKVLSTQQVSDIQSAIYGSRENESMATGAEHIPNPLESQIRIVEKNRSDAASAYEARLRAREKTIEELRRDVNNLTYELAEAKRAK